MSITKENRDAWIARLQQDHAVFRIAGAAEAVIDKLIEDPDFDFDSILPVSREPMQMPTIEVISGAESEKIWEEARRKQQEEKSEETAE